MADNSVREKRIQFVEGLNKPIIYDLLDDLLEKKILNDGEIEEVKEVQKTTKDKARCLVDMVVKKGPRASEIFLQCAQARDPQFYYTLNL